MEAKTGSVRAFFYLYRKILKNRVKKALRKPVTYIYLAFVIWYFGFLFTTFGEGFDSMFDSFGIDKASALTVVLTVLTFFFVPSNLISYSKRKSHRRKENDRNKSRAPRRIYFKGRSISITRSCHSRYTSHRYIDRNAFVEPNDC